MICIILDIHSNKNERSNKNSQIWNIRNHIRCSSPNWFSSRNCRRQQRSICNQKKSNESLQDIIQESSTGESAECFSNNNTLASCNNVALSLNLNDGNNAEGQQ